MREEPGILAVTPESARAFMQALREAGSAVIGTHLNPDGDALGSALALSHFLDQHGIPSEVLCHHPAPRNLEFLPGIERLHRTAAGQHRMAVMVDLESIERLGDAGPSILAAERLAVIDHHVPHEAPGDMRFIDTTSPATSLILTRLFRALDAPINPIVATCLLTGIVTDTGSFRFRNTTPEALSLSAFLVECGADITMVSEEVFQNKPLASVKLLGHMLETMRIACDARIAWGVLQHEDFERSGAADENTEGFVNEMLAIDTVEIAALLREPKAGKVRCSLRSRGDHDVASIAREFGGGGHRNAAGCTFELPMPEAEALVVSRMKACLACS